MELTTKVTYPGDEDTGKSDWERIGLPIIIGLCVALLFILAHLVINVIPDSQCWQRLTKKEETAKETLTREDGAPYVMKRRESLKKRLKRYRQKSKADGHDGNGGGSYERSDGSALVPGAGRDSHLEELGIHQMNSNGNMNVATRNSFTNQAFSNEEEIKTPYRYRHSQILETNQGAVGMLPNRLSDVNIQNQNSNYHDVFLNGHQRDYSHMTHARPKTYTPSSEIHEEDMQVASFDHNTDRPFGEHRHRSPYRPVAYVRPNVYDDSSDDNLDAGIPAKIDVEVSVHKSLQSYHKNDNKAADVNSQCYHLNKPRSINNKTNGASDNHFSHGKTNESQAYQQKIQKHKQLISGHIMGLSRENVSEDNYGSHGYPDMRHGGGASSTYDETCI